MNLDPFWVFLILTGSVILAAYLLWAEFGGVE